MKPFTLIALYQSTLLVAEFFHGRIPIFRPIVPHSFQGRFRDSVVSAWAVGREVGFKRVVIGDSRLNELVEHLPAEGFSCIGCVFGAVVLLDVIHDALGDGARSSFCVRPGSIWF